MAGASLVYAHGGYNGSSITGITFDGFQLITLELDPTAKVIYLVYRDPVGAVVKTVNQLYNGASTQGTGPLSFNQRYLFGSTSVASDRVFLSNLDGKILFDLTGVGVPTPAHRTVFNGITYDGHNYYFLDEGTQDGNGSYSYTLYIIGNDFSGIVAQLTLNRINIGQTASWIIDKISGIVFDGQHLYLLLQETLGATTVNEILVYDIEKNTVITRITVPFTVANGVDLTVMGNNFVVCYGTSVAVLLRGSL